jgi:cytoskeletal protein RodZ
MALSKTHGLCFLFTLLIIVLIVSPRSLNNLYNNTLGRLALIALIIFFAMHNVTLGLLAALCIIIASNMYMFEGFDGMSEEDKEKLKNKMSSSTTTPSTSTTPSTTTTSTTSTDGVDKEAIKDAIQAKASNTITVAKTNFASTEVEPTAAPSTTTQEGFSSMSAPY